MFGEKSLDFNLDLVAGDCFRASPLAMTNSKISLVSFPNHFLLSNSYYSSINPFHLRTEAAEDDFLYFLRSEIADRPHGNLGSVFPGVAIDAGGNSGEGDRLAIVLFSKGKAAFIARFEKLRFPMFTVTINRSRCMNHELRRQLEPGSDFRLSRLATSQRNA